MLTGLTNLLRQELNLEGVSKLSTHHPAYEALGVSPVLFTCSILGVEPFFSGIYWLADSFNLSRLLSSGFSSAFPTNSQKPYTSGFPALCCNFFLCSSIIGFISGYLRWTVGSMEQIKLTNKTIDVSNSDFQMN